MSGPFSRPKVLAFLASTASKAFILGFTAVSILSCSDEEEPRSTPTSTASRAPEVQSTPTQTPIHETPPLSQITIPPTSSEGPVAVYGKEQGPAAELVAYDLRTAHALWRIPMGGAEPIAFASGGGNRLVLASRSRALLYTFDGSPVLDLMRTSDSTEAFQSLSVSADGRLLAIVLHDEEPPGTPLPPGIAGPPVRWKDTLIFFDLDQQQEVGRVESTSSEFDAFLGFFGPLTWLPDNEGVFMWGQTNSERAGGYATVFLDGTVQQHDLAGFAYVSPNAQLAVEGMGSLGCMFISGNDVLLQDLSSSQDLFTIRDPERAFTGLAWSPDSREFLFESRPWRSDLDCLDGWWAAEPDLFLLNVESGEAKPVRDVEDVYKRWYQDKPTWIDCAGRFVPPDFYPFGSVLALRCDGVAEGTLYIRGAPVEVGRLFQLIDVLE
jgi:hypothetical protein